MIFNKERVSVLGDLLFLISGDEVTEKIDDPFLLFFNLNYSVKENEFYNLKNKAERSNDILLSKTDKNDPNSAKIRKGKIGGYRDELKQSTIEYIDNYIKKNLI